MTDPYAAQAAGRFYPGALGGRAQGVTPINIPTGQRGKTRLVERCVVFAFTGAPQSWMVPYHEGDISLAVFGADGSIFGIAPHGSVGARCFGQVTLSPGDVLDLYVGGHPPHDGDRNGLYTWPPGHGRIGGWPDGGDAPSNPVTPDPYNSRLFAGGGGGSSRIELSGTILLQAGGGGGGTTGEDPASLITVNGGGNGGNQNGGDGDGGSDVGTGGTTSAGGTAGTGGTNGAYQAGGDGGQVFNVIANAYGAAGGGGGGGYYGGGGGASGVPGGSPNIINIGTAGGGGSSYADGTVTGASFNFGPDHGAVFELPNDGLITICYFRPG